MGVRGNSGGKKGRSGRKSKAEEMGLTALLDKCFTKADREDCIKKLAQDSKSDDFHTRHEARKLLFAYTFGKPAEKHEVSNPDGSPLMAPIADAMLKVYGSGSTK